MGNVTAGSKFVEQGTEFIELSEGRAHNSVTRTNDLVYAQQTANTSRVISFPVIDDYKLIVEELVAASHCSIKDQSDITIANLIYDLSTSNQRLLYSIFEEVFIRLADSPESRENFVKALCGIEFKSSYKKLFFTVLGAVNNSRLESVFAILQLIDSWKPPFGKSYLASEKFQSKLMDNYRIDIFSRYPD